MSFDPCLALTAYHDAIERRDFAFMQRQFADEITYASPGIGLLRGKTDVLAAISRYFENMPDQVAKDDRVWRVSDLSAACTWSLKATDVRTGAVGARKGSSTITFNGAGQIISVVVVDEV